MEYNTSLPFLDVTIGGNGIPVKSMIQLFGSSDTGKSSIALFFAKHYLDKFNGSLLYVDTEFKIEEIRFDYIMKDYISNNRVSLVKENKIDTVFKTIETFMKEEALKNGTSMIILDTIANLMPEEGEGVAGYSGAKLVAEITKWLRYISNLKHKCNSHILILNQVRDNVSGMGKKTKTPRGNQLSHIVNVKMNLRTLKSNMSEFDKITFSNANIVKYVMEKNHLFIPKMSGVLVVDESGVDEQRSLFEYCIEYGIFKKSGSWKSIDLSDIGEDKVKFQSFNQFKELYNNDIIKDYIYYKIYKKYLTLSPLSFIKLINKVNEYEEKLGLSKTNIPDELKEYEYIINKTLKGE